MAMLVYSSVVIPLNPHLLLLAFSLFLLRDHVPPRGTILRLPRKQPRNSWKNSTSTHFSTKYHGNQQIPKLLPSCDLDQKHCWPHIPHLAPWVAGLSKKKNRSRQWALWTLHYFRQKIDPRCHGREQRSMQIFSSGNLSTHQGEQVSHEK